MHANKYAQNMMQQNFDMLHDSNTHDGVCIRRMLSLAML